MKKATKKTGPDAYNISRSQRAFKQGRRAEAYARWVLRAKDYCVLARNFRHPLGEVGFIVRCGRQLLFDKGKFCADRDTGPFAVPLAQWRRISAGASGLVTRHPQYAGCFWRFDTFVGGRNGRFRHNKTFRCP